MNIGERIKYFRKLRRISGMELADKLFVSQSQISRYENNENLPPIDTLIEMCEIFGITLSQFFDENSGQGQLTDEILLLIETAKKLKTEELKKLNEFLKLVLERSYLKE